MSQHPFSEWTQDDFWGLAAYFSRTRKVSKGDFTLTEASSDGTGWSTASITIPEGSGKASGKVVPARLLGGGQPSRIADPLRPQLADWLTADTNPYFARAMVNRLWAHCMGRGLIEPLDDQREGNEPTHPALLQLLADEFVASGYDVRHILRCIVLTEPYQVDAQPTPENTADRSYYSHRLARAMVPDVLYDSLGVAMNPILIRPSSPSGKPTDKFSGNHQLEPRDKFIRFFGRAALDDTGEVFSYGIPQLLRLMNGSESNQPLGFLTGLIKNESDPSLRIDTLYLIALSRRPTSVEQQRMLRLVGDDTESIDGYGSVWWVLLNSSEFMVHD